MSEGRVSSADAEQVNRGQRIERAVKGTRETVGRVVDTARGRVQSVLHEARHSVGNVRERFAGLAERRSEDLMREAGDLVRRHPGTSVLVAVSAGFLLGWLLRGKE
jgi:ElaB/YqjD/DUF883 family membrane-anchored ribosome-binding protein